VFLSKIEIDASGRQTDPAWSSHSFDSAMEVAFAREEVAFEQNLDWDMVDPPETATQLDAHDVDDRFEKLTSRDTCGRARTGPRHRDPDAPRIGFLPDHQVSGFQRPERALASASSGLSSRALVAACALSASRPSERRQRASPIHASNEVA